MSRTDLKDTERLVAHSLYALAGAPRRDWPYKHIVLENFLDPELFQAVRALPLSGVLQPAAKGALTNSPAEANRTAILLTGDAAPDLDRYPPLRALREVLTDRALTRMYVGRFRDELVPRLGTGDLAVGHALQVIEDRSGYRLPPHTDTPQKLVTVLIYFAEDDDDPRLGTELFALRKGRGLPETWQPHMRLSPSLFVRAATVPYRPNTALIFAPGTSTFHGVGIGDGDNDGSATGGEDPPRRRLVQYQVLLNGAGRRRPDRESG